MKKAFLFSLLMILTVMLILSCSSDKKTNPDTESPTVIITYPPDNSSFVSGTAISIVAEAYDNEEVDNVKFYIDGVNLYEDTSEPYTYNWDTTDLSGSHPIYAKASDSSENTTTSDIITVTITDEGEAPNPPSNPNPQSGATNIYISTTLSWTCSDPDPNDILTYDIYFGTYPNPPLLEQSWTDTTYVLDELNPVETYYWKIVAHDDHSNLTTGDIWEFTTYGGGGGNFEWCYIPAGDYTYGVPPVTQNISYDFQIMKYEVTNQKYVDYMVEALYNGNITVTGSIVEGYYEGDQNYNAGNYEFLELNSVNGRIDWNGSSFSIISGYEEHPVVEVTWFGSWAFAEHYGFSLPTEQEWEKAARGNTGYNYPWGNNIDGSRANYGNSGDPWDNGTTPIGMYNGQTIQGFSTTDSPSPYGVYDLAGNVWKWTDSWWNEYPSSRVVRGGGCYSVTSQLQSWHRGCLNPTRGYGNVGFRCVVL